MDYRKGVRACLKSQREQLMAISLGAHHKVRKHEQLGTVCTHSLGTANSKAKSMKEPEPYYLSCNLAQTGLWSDNGFSISMIWPLTAVSFFGL